MNLSKTLCISTLALVVASTAQAAEKKQNAKKTKLKPPQYSEIWSPKVPVVEVEKTGQAPSDAIVLFDGGNFDQWQKEKGNPVEWTLNDDASMTVKPKTGSIQTIQKFCDIQLHLEWKSPEKAAGKSGQQLGNSGIFMQGLYEIQILDSYQNETYSNGQAGSVYKQHLPLANPTRAPGEWNQYDIIYTAPRFNDNGFMKTPARFTALHNGVLVLHNAELQGPTTFIGTARYEKAHGCEPIKLQNHNSAVSFKNIWVRPL